MGRFGVLAGWRSLSLVAWLVVLAMVSPLGSVSVAQAAVAPAAVPQSLSLSAPATVETRVAFALSGAALPVRPGRVVAVQRLSGRSWIEVGRMAETSAGRYSVAVSLTTAGKMTYRAVALAGPGAAAVASVSRGVSAHLPYILLTPSKAMAAELVKVTGLLPGIASRPVWVQRLSGKTWVTLVKAATSRTGSYSTLIGFPAPGVGSYAVRSLAPRVTVARKVRAQYVTAARTLTVLAQSASLTMPAALVQATSGTVTMTFAPVRAGRPVALQVLKAGVWTAVASGKQSVAGATSLPLTAGAPGSYPYRAYTAAAARAAAFASATKTLKVTPPPVSSATAVPTSTSVRLSWVNPAAVSVTRVMIRRAVGAVPPASASAGSLVADVARPAASFTDIGLASATTYSYALFAHDVTPVYSSGVPVTTNTIAYPGPVTGQHATPGKTSISLAWVNPGEASLTGVMIRRLEGVSPPSSITDGELVTLVQAPVVSYVDNGPNGIGLIPGRDYSYALFAHDVTLHYSPAATLTATTVIGAVSVSTGHSHSCAVTLEGGVKCWGVNGDGELGNDSVVRSAVPVAVSGFGSGGALVPVVAVGVGDSHSCAQTSAGGVRCWGLNDHGQLGDGSTNPSLVPVDVAGLDPGVTAIAIGSNFSCAVTSSGAQCWGYNAYGQLGDYSIIESSVPVHVVGLDPGVKALSAGVSHACAVTSSGVARCWGLNEDGQLGDSTHTVSRVPVDVVGLGSGVTAISAGRSHSCAVISSGAVRCWGYNGSGELGDGTTASSSVPVDVLALDPGATAVSAGLAHSCAVTSSQAVRCWGYNSSGELGNNTTADSWVPVDVWGLGSRMSAVAAGEQYTCAVKPEGTVACWGFNGFGQLGDGTNDSSASPVFAVGLG